MNNRKPLENFEDIDAFKNSINSIDVIVIGTQETYTYFIQEWILIIQSMIGQSYVLKKRNKLENFILYCLYTKKYLISQQLLKLK